MSTKNSLQDLLTYGLIEPGDTIEFTFKSHTFRSSLYEGGILADAQWMKPSSKAFAACFMDRSGFDSLTDWCDSCIQELLDEYTTRFSGWKRCKHAQTGSPMAMLRDEIKGRKVVKQRNVHDLLLAEQKRNIFLQEQIRLLKNQKRKFSSIDDNPFRLRL